MSHPSGTHSWYETVAGDPICAACGCAGWEWDAATFCAGSKRGRDKEAIEREFTGGVEQPNDMLFW